MTTCTRLFVTVIARGLVADEMESKAPVTVYVPAADGVRTREATVSPVPLTLKIDFKDTSTSGEPSDKVAVRTSSAR